MFGINGIRYLAKNAQIAIGLVISLQRRPAQIVRCLKKSVRVAPASDLRGGISLGKFRNFE
jgi:hypothetical protein